MTKFIKFSFSMEESDIRDVFIVLLSQLPFEGIEEEESAFYAYASNSAWKPIHFDELNAIVSEYHQSYDIEEVEPKNWNAAWEANYQPILIPRVVYVRASFHKKIDLHKRTTEIVIDPKMSFGTGHHATTKMMLEELRKIELKDRRVLDFGAGTGILSIAASKWKAKKVFAVEIEEIAYENMIENFATNKVSNYRAYCGGAEKIPEKKFDVILANVNKEVLEKTADVFRRRCRNDGVLVMSGILDKDKKELTKLYRNLGFRVDSVDASGDWTMIALRKRG